MPDPQTPPWVQTLLDDAQSPLAPWQAQAAVTPPPQSAQPPLAVPFQRRASGKTGGSVTTTVGEAQAGAQRQDNSYAAQLLATPVTGTERALKGMATLGRAFPGGEDTRGWGVAPPAGPRPSLRQIAGGAADVVGGGMEASTLALPGAIAKAPLKVGTMLLAGTGVGSAVYAAGKAMGIAPEYVDLAAQTLGLAGGIAAGHVVDSPELRTSLLTEAKRIYTDQTGAVSLPTFLGAQRRGVVEPRVSGAPPTGEVVTPSTAPTTPTTEPALTPPQQLTQPELPTPALAEIKTLFPRLDKYSKPSGRLSGPTILKRLEAAPDISPEARATLTQLADQVGDRRISPDELHALSQGEAYTPERIVRRVTTPVEGTKQRPGAPYGVTNARQERGLRERYIQRMVQGAGGRDWYTDAGEAIKFAANDDPVRANLVAEDLAATSPATTVSANTGFGVKGYNQATAGVPVEAGRFPTAMGKVITAIHAPGEAGVTGLKRTPFAQNLARGGDFLLSGDPPRAVHDIWDAEAHGYMNADGSPMRVGFGPAQHRWMDTQQDKILSTANERAAGGFTDWDELRSQASTWTAQQIEAGVLDPQDAAKSYADYLAKLAAQGSRETVPGRTTGHMPELAEPDMEAYRQQLHDTMTRESGIYDAEGRDQIAAGYGGLVGRAFDGPGLYEGRHAQGTQTQVLTGSLEAPGGPKGARVLDQGSRRILDATEATHGLLTGQDASAYSRLLPAGSGAPRTGWDVVLPGGTVTPEQMRTLALRLPDISRMALIPTPDGIRLGQMDEATMKTIVKALGGRVKEAGSLQGNVLTNDWRTQELGQGYWEAIRRMGTEKFDRFAPAIAERLRGIDARFARETGGRFTLSPVLDEVRGAIANEGFAGLERLAKKYGLPVMALVGALTTLQGSAPPAAPPATVGSPPTPPPM